MLVERIEHIRMECWVSIFRYELNPFVVRFLNLQSIYHYIVQNARALWALHCPHFDTRSHFGIRSHTECEWFLLLRCIFHFIIIFIADWFDCFQSYSLKCHMHFGIEMHRKVTLKPCRCCRCCHTINNLHIFVVVNKKRKTALHSTSALTNFVRRVLMLIQFRNSCKCSFFVSILLTTWQNDNRMKQVTCKLNWRRLTR